MKINKVEYHKQITVIDDLYTPSQLEGMYLTCCMSNYNLANANHGDVQNLQDRKLVSHLDLEQLDDCEVFNEVSLPILQDECQGYIPYKAYINLNTFSDVNKTHVDSYFKDSGKTILIYPNKKWENDWGGETVFYNDEGTDIVFTSIYRPGRVVVFDSTIPHCAKPQSIFADTYRFTIAVKLQKEKVK